MADARKEFIFPKPLINRFAAKATYPTCQSQVLGFLYGYEERDVCCIAMVPQWGTDQQVHVSALPRNHLLEGYKPLGVIRTGLDIDTLSPADILSFCGHDHLEGTYSVVAVLTPSLTEGLESLKVFKITARGLDWGHENKESLVVDLHSLPDNYCEPLGFKMHAEHSGHFMVPLKPQVWNYNFMVVDHVKNLDYQLVLGEPMAYLDYSHNPRESLRFASVLDDDYHFENSEKETKKRRQRKKMEKRWR